MDDSRIPVDSLASSLAFEIMREQFATVLSGVEHLRRAHDMEVLHDVRVANRRLRAAIAVFGPVLPKRAESLRVRLGEFGQILGEMRDLDVLLERVASAIAAGSDPGISVLRVLERKRATLRTPLVKSLESVKIRRLLSSAELFLTTGPLTSAPNTSVAHIAKAALVQSHERVCTLGDAIVPLKEHAPEAGLHTLRIRTKRLRYTVEMFEPAFGNAAKEFAQRARGVQDILGEHRDAGAAARKLRDFAAEMSPLAAFETGRVAQDCLDQSRKALKDLPSAYKRLKGGRWRKLLNAAEDAAAVTSREKLSRTAQEGTE